ncbi:hypothetical protein BDZ89DRAFT_1040986 [Hymenopellis radicata]|nr:hypothetical protein BDZ89DRAFT_1040986 [Hymenopellis radicata]
MLGVSTSPSLNVTGFGGFGGPSSSKLPNVPTGPPNGSSSSAENEIAEIKAKAREVAKSTMRSQPTLHLVRAAKALYDRGRMQERDSDARVTLTTFTKMSQIMQHVLLTVQPAEFREAMKEWPSYEQDQNNAKTLSEGCEAKIKSAATADDGGVKSIQDRLQSLRANGLQVTSKQTKRAPLPPAPAPVQTPQSSGSSRRMSAPPSPLKQSILEPTPVFPPSANGTAAFSLPSVPLVPMVPSRSFASTSSHTFVPTATLGDSPLSSPSNSPHIPQQNLTVLSEDDDYRDAEASYPSIGQFEMAHPSPSPNIFPMASSFAARHFDPVERAASVPPAPSYTRMLPSRPASPTKPSLHRKQSIIQDSTPLPKPKSSASPDDLMAFKKSKSIHTLLIDVRTRADFDKEHIDNQAILCIEPIILNRNGLTAEALENALELNPKAELTLFQNRHIFEYVLIYDQNSVTPSNTMKSLMDAIFVNSVHGKTLKHPPMLLVGGLDAWKSKYGDEQMIRGALTTKSYSPRPLPTVADPYATTNGLVSPTFASQPMEPTQLWNSRSRADTNPSPHRATFSVDQGPSHHTRSPAETNYTGRLQSKQDGSSSSLGRRSAVTRPPTSAGPSSFGYATNGISYPNARMSPATTGTEIASPAPVSLNHTITRRRSDYMEPPSYTNASSPSGAFGVNVDHSASAAGCGTWHRHASAPDELGLVFVAKGATGCSTETAAAVCAKECTALLERCGDWDDGVAEYGQYMLYEFGDGRWRNEVNKYALRPGSSKGSKEFLDGKTAFLFSNVLRTLWGSDLPYIVPTDIWSHMATQYEGFNNKRQHDAGEWMGNLLALLSVELNRVTDPDDGSRPDEWFLDLATRPPAESNYKAWEKELMKENSIVFDCFGSLTRTMRQCQRCMKKSPSYLSNTILPLTFLPKYGSSKLSARQCFESIFQTDEDMKGTNKWLCPVCKSLQDAKATTRLSHAPPVLLLQLSRYEDSSNGKKKNLADFPLRDLDISEWMVTLDQEVGGPSADDARSQRAPYRYDLYAVVNHDGQTIDSGHCVLVSDISCVQIPL